MLLSLNLPRLALGRLMKMTSKMWQAEGLIIGLHIYLIHTNQFLKNQGLSLRQLVFAATREKFFSHTWELYVLP